MSDDGGCKPSIVPLRVSDLRAAAAKKRPVFEEKRRRRALATVVTTNYCELVYLSREVRSARQLRCERPPLIARLPTQGYLDAVSHFPEADRSVVQAAVDRELDHEVEVLRDAVTRLVSADRFAPSLPEVMRCLARRSAKSETVANVFAAIDGAFALASLALSVADQTAMRSAQ